MTDRSITQARTSRPRTRYLRPALGAMALALAALPCAPALASGRPGASESATSYPAYQGPKKTIAVARFDAVGSFVAQYGGWDIGGGLAAMLATELARTNRFVVVERAGIDTLLREKQMALGDVTRGTTGGPLLGAQTFIHASVTAFDQQTSGGGLNLGLNLPGLGNGGAGMRRSTGHVAIDMRLIDGETGAVLATVHVEKRVRSSSLALQGRANNVSFGGDQFQQTSLGQASREAIAEAVGQIVTGMERVPFQALVAKADGDRIVINAGRSANLVPGTHMRVIRTAETITDPQTGEVLGSSRQTVGMMVIDNVQDRYATGRMMDGASLVRTSDIVQAVNP